MNIEIIKMKSLALAVVLFSSMACAQQINALRFQNVMSSTSFYVEDGLNAEDKFTKDYRGFFTVSYETVDKLLPVVTADGTNTFTELVSQFQRVRLTGAYYVTPKLAIGVTLPVDIIEGRQRFQSGNTNLSQLNLENSGPILGDVGVGLKYKLTDYDDLWNLTFFGQLFFPTGDPSWYNTDDSYRVTAGIAAAKFIGSSRDTKVYGNLGLTLANNSQLDINNNFEILDTSRRFNLGLGLSQRLNKSVEVFTEFASQLSLPLGEFSNPTIFNIGTNVYFKQFSLYGGAGLENTLLGESSENRYFAGVKYYFKKRQLTWLPEQDYSQPQKIAYVPSPAKVEDVSPSVSRDRVLNKLQAALKVARRVNFQTGKAIIIPTHYSDLDVVVELLHKLDGYVSKVKIEGHTDSRGDFDKNMNLSLERANSIKDYLVSRGKLSPELFETKGYGSAQPLVEEVDQDSQKINRRVEIYVERVEKP